MVGIVLEILDKLVLFISSFLFYAYTDNDPYALIPALIVITLSCFCSYINKPYMRIFSIIIYIILTFFFPRYLIYLPIILYDIFFTEHYRYAYLSTLPLFVHYSVLDRSYYFFIPLLLCGSILSKYKTFQILHLLNE